jgi:hypothetical protein
MTVLTTSCNGSREDGRGGIDVLPKLTITARFHGEFVGREWHVSAYAPKSQVPHGFAGMFVGVGTAEEVCGGEGGENRQPKEAGETHCCKL